jgi:hypothetical protein
MRQVIGLVIFLTAGFVHAATINIGFDEYQLGDSDPIDSQGVLFTSPTGLFIGSKEDNTALLPGGSDDFMIEMTALNGSSFDLIYFEYNNLFSLTVTGNYEGGGSIERVFAPNGEFLEGWGFDELWVNLQSVEFSAAGSFVALDNIVVSGDFAVSAVPIPAAAWLFGSALAGLGWMRRKQTI